MVLWQVIFTSLVLLAFWYWRNWRWIKMSWNTPGPFALLPLGSVLCYPLLLKLEDAVNNMMVIIYAYPKLVRFWLGPYFILILRHPEEVKSFFASKGTSTKSFIFSKWKDLMGLGLVTSSGQLWKLHRRLVNPFFNGVLLKGYQSIYVRQSKILVKSFDEYCNKEPIDVLLNISRCTGDILAEAIFKVKPHFQEGHMDKYIHAVDDMAKASFQRMTQIWLHPRFIFDLSETGKKGNAALERIQEYAMLIVNENLENVQAKDKDQIGTVGALLRNWNEENGVASIEEIRDEVQNLFSAGMDTSATIIAFLMLMLAIHKDSQIKVWKEMEQLYSDDPERDVVLEDLPQLQYLDWCFKEVCRLFSVGFITLRDVLEDVHISTSHSNYIIPSGTTVMISNHLLHMDATLWEEPGSFRPERFSPEKATERHPYAYLPFGAGPRQCLGLRFSAESVKTMLIYVIRRFELHSDWQLKDIPLNGDISIRSCWGYKMSFARRNLPCK